MIEILIHPTLWLPFAKKRRVATASSTWRNVPWTWSHCCQGLVDKPILQSSIGPPWGSQFPNHEAVLSHHHNLCNTVSEIFHRGLCLIIKIYLWACSCQRHTSLKCGQGRQQLGILFHQFRQLQHKLLTSGAPHLKRSSWEKFGAEN